MKAIDTNDLAKYLKEIEPFYYWQNDGNLGDYIIAEATQQLFKRANLNWKPYDPLTPPPEESYNIVYSGGGRFVPYWGGIELRQKHLTRKEVKKCIILPHSINGVDNFVNALDERHTVFCREKNTLTYCQSLNSKSRFVLAHDVGIFLELNDVTPLNQLYKPNSKEEPEIIRQYELLTGEGASHARFRVRQATITHANNLLKIAFFLREDGEKGISFSSKWAYDISGIWSGTCKKNSCSGPLLMFMAELTSYPDIIVTDRLHVAIMGMHLGKEVYMLDNDYGKLSGVYELSLKDNPRIHLLEAGKPWPKELQKAWDALNAPYRHWYYNTRRLAGRIIRKFRSFLCKK